MVDDAVRVEHLRVLSSHALELLEEYYSSIGVVAQDSADAMRTALANRSASMWLAYVGEAPAGCVVLKALSTRENAAECKRLFVRPAWRRRGLADALMDELEEHASRGAFRWVYLDSKDDLAEAIALYRRRGYSPCERYNSNPQATLFLRKELPSARKGAAAPA